MLLGDIDGRLETVVEGLALEVAEGLGLNSSDGVPDAVALGDVDGGLETVVEGLELADKLGAEEGAALGIDCIDCAEGWLDR